MEIALINFNHDWTKRSENARTPKHNHDHAVSGCCCCLSLITCSVSCQPNKQRSNEYCRRFVRWMVLQNVPNLSIQSAVIHLLRIKSAHGQWIVLLPLHYWLLQTHRKEAGFVSSKWLHFIYCGLMNLISINIHLTIKSLQRSSSFMRWEEILFSYRWCRMHHGHTPESFNFP